MDLVLFTWSLAHFGVQLDHFGAVISQAKRLPDHERGKRAQLRSQFVRLQKVQTGHGSTLDVMCVLYFSGDE